jgi:hypothetical protein
MMASPFASQWLAHLSVIAKGISSQGPLEHGPYGVRLFSMDSGKHRRRRYARL